MAAHRVARAEEVGTGAFTPVKIGRATVLVTRLPNGSLTAIAAKCSASGSGVAPWAVPAATSNRIEK